jgi:hypothetical protein
MSLQLPTGLEPDTLNEIQKHWLAVAICSAITADGNIAPEEIQYMERALGFLESKSEANKIIQAVKDQKLPKLERFPEGTRQIEVQIFIELLLVVCADNVLGTNEIDFLLTIGRKLGFGREYVRITIRWASEGIVWKRKMHNIIRMGSELQAEYA